LRQQEAPFWGFLPFKITIEKTCFSVWRAVALELLASAACPVRVIRQRRAASRVARDLSIVMAGLDTKSWVYPTFGTLNLHNSGKPELWCHLA
jgi:hypothetical protein